MNNHLRSSIVVTFDRLGSGYLGPYGNTWIETPNFNQLASESCLFEFATTGSPCLQATYRTLWSGRHVLDRREVHTNDSLAAILAGRDVGTIFITDEPALREHPLARGFAETILLESQQIERSADEESQTQMARLMASALDCLASVAPPYLVWIHSRGMQGPWDAPYGLRRQFADEEDPDPPTFLDPPSRVLPDDFDPDQLLGITHAYAAQVVLADLCLGALLDALGHNGAGAPLLAVTSPRGYALGEHRAVGTAGDALYGEVLQAPLLVRLPGGEVATRRSSALVQSADLFATLRQWHGASAQSSETTFGENLLPVLHGDAELTRHAVCSAFGDERSIRTPAWFLRREGEEVQLYVKPDDRWEINEVSDRCDDVARQLLELLEAGERELTEHGRLSPRELDDALLYGFD
jgi:arylsulfatase A-like enzyme